MKNPNMSAASKERAARQVRHKGKFTALETTTDIAVPKSPLPPNANVDFGSLFVAQPNPVQGIFYNPDEAFLSNPENASRMIQDMAIFSALQERELATSALPWSIVPEDDEDPAQVEAAEAIEKIARELPNMPDFLRNALDSIFYGRSGAYIDYRWDFSTGTRRMIPKGWTPVHGDTLVYADDGRIGYKVGATLGSKDVVVGVMGRAVMVKQEPLVETLPDGSKAAYLQPEERKAWVVHHHQKTAGEFRIFTSAAAKWGLGLRSRLYPIWLLKQSALQFYMQAAEKFGAGWVIGYFDGGNPRSAEAVRQALQKQVGSCVQMFPRFGPEAEAIEGMEVIDPPSQGFEAMMNIIGYYDDQIAVTIKGQKLTSENEKGGGLGSNKAEVQQSTFGRLIKYDSAALGETLTDQFIAVLQEFNGYGHLPKLRFEFSFDIGTTTEKLANAKLIYEMGGRFDMTDLMQDCGLTPVAAEPIDTTQVDENGEVIDTTDREPTGGIETAPAFGDEGNLEEDGND